MYRITIWGLRFAALAAILMFALEPAMAAQRGGGGRSGGGGARGGGGAVRVGGGGVRVGGGAVRVGGGAVRVGGGAVRVGGDRYRGNGYGYGRVGIGIGIGGWYGGYGDYGGPDYYGYGYSYPAYSDYYPDYTYAYPNYADSGTVVSTPYYNNGVSYYGGPTDAADQADANAIMVDVHVPPDAQVWFDGTPTTQAGEWRRFASPPMTAIQNYQYQVRARWTENGKAMDQTRRVDVRPGQRSIVDFTRPESATIKPPIY